MPTNFRFTMLATCFALGLALPATAQQAPASACLEPASWAVPAGSVPRLDPAPTILTEMARRDVVLLGEQHDDADHHRWQLQTLAALHAQRPAMVIGFEMFPRRVQAVLDRWVEGTLSEEAFLEQTGWDEVWSMPAELYMPLFQFARLNRIPMLALNVEQQLIRDISARGWGAIAAPQREGVGTAAEPPAAYVDFLFEIHNQHAGMRPHQPRAARKDDASFRRFVEAQLAWDRAMAEVLARPLATAPDPRPLVVGIMGSGHIRFGHGVPHQLRALGIDSVGTMLPMAADAPCSEIPPGLADAVFAVPPRTDAPPPPPRLGIALDVHRDGVRVVEVTAGSLAEATGLRAEDIIVEVAGERSITGSALVASVRAQPAGTWLPLKVRRGSDTVDLVVKFPARL